MLRASPVPAVTAAPVRVDVVTDRADWTTYRSRVQQLPGALAALPSDAPVRLRKPRGTSNLFRPRASAHAALDGSGLAGVLSVDRDSRTADVLGLTTYEDLVDATLPHGLIPLVVP